MRTTKQSHACVIGGGPAGLAAAIAISQAGFRATIVDHAVPPIDKACGEGLMPDSVSVLQQLGVTISLDAGARFKGIRFCDAHSSVTAKFPCGFGIGLRRVTLHDLLLRRAEELGVDCVWGARRVQVNDTHATVNGERLACDFVVAADGQNSPTRRSCGLGATVRERRRFGFRRHYRVAPWSDYMELNWGPGCQIYVTPVAHDEVCVVSMSRSAHVRLDEALQYFPALQQQLAGAEQCSREAGSLSVSRKFRRVCRDGVALLGDASGSVDAITG